MLPFKRANILLPKDVDMTKWSVVACDQYTSEPEYWSDVEKIVGDSPSTLKLTLPEIYLEEFFGNIQLNGYIDLIHPSNNISNEDCLYSRIEKEDLFNRLKFVLIKSNDEDAFEIKDSFIKNIGAKYAE